jgi:PPOX class probable F420-dependent enzyme
MSRRDQIVMTDEEVAAYLNGKATIVINTIGRDGVPHPAPMWFAVEDDGAIVMTTFTKSQKIQNLKRDPRVTLLLEDGTVYAELRGVIFHGVAELHRDTDFVLRILREINARGKDGGAADALSEAEQAGMRAQAEKRTAIRVRPVKVVSWDHRKLGGVY